MPGLTKEGEDEYFPDAREESEGLDFWVDDEETFLREWEKGSKSEKKLDEEF